MLSEELLHLVLPRRRKAGFYQILTSMKTEISKERQKTIIKRQKRKKREKLGKKSIGEMNEVGKRGKKREKNGYGRRSRRGP